MAARQRFVKIASAALVTSMIALLGLGGVSIAATTPPKMSLLRGNTAPIPQGDKVIGAARSSAKLSLEVALAPRDPGALTAAVRAVSTPKSPQYRHFLAPGQFAQLYGATPAVISAVTTTLRRDGLAVGPISATGLSLPVTGTVAEAESAFDTTLSSVREPTGKIGFYNERAPRISATIAPYVQGIVGLDTLVQPQAMNSGPIKALQAVGERKPLANHDTQVLAPGQPAPTTSCGSSFSQLENSQGSHIASQFAQSYNLDPLYATGAYGAGTTVALAEFGAANYVPSDISTFANCYGISSYQLSEEGDTSLGTGGNSDETELDVETVLSLAPAAAIEVYQAGTAYDGNGYYSLFNRIVGDDSAKIVNVSYGTCEDEQPTSWMNEENTVLQAGALEGQTFFASSGDTGSEACNGGGPNGVTTGNHPMAQVVDPSTGTLYVVNNGDDNVDVFDENSGALLTTVPTGASPDAIVLDSATSQIYVANWGSNSLTAFSTSACQTSNVSGCSTTTTMTGSQFNKPSSLFVNAQTLYVGNDGNATVTVNSLSGSYDATVQLQAYANPAAIAVDATGDVYVADSYGQQLYYFSGCTNSSTSGCSTVNHLNMGNAPDALVFDPSNGDLYVASVFDYSTLQSGAIGVVDTTTHTETKVFDTGGSQISSVALTPNGVLLAATQYQGELLSINASTGALLGSVSVTANDTMGQITYDPNLNYLWMTDLTSNVDLVEDLNLGVNDPASQPDVTGVGGTSLSTQEVAWTDGGGGVSDTFDMPSYQTSLGTIAGSSGTPCGNASGNCREVPDVSADADPNAGESVYASDQGGWAEFGGTSLAAPIWAATLAVISSASSNTAGFGLLNPTLYSLAGARPGTYFNDVTTGDNDEIGSNGGDFAAGPGYDMATGLGTPNAYALFVGLKGGHSLLNVTLSASERQPNLNGGWLFTATTSATGALAAGTGTITITLPSGSNFIPGSQIDIDSTLAATISGTHNTVTVTTPVSIGIATTFTLSANSTNLATGTYTNAFTLLTSSDTTPTHLEQPFEIGSTLSNVQFSASTQIANATSTWTVQATTSATGALTPGDDWIDIKAPSGTQFSPIGTYTVNGVTPSINAVQTGGAPEVIIYTPVSIGNSSSITIVMTDVTNPSGNFSSTSDFSVQTDADTSNFATPGLNFTTPSTSVTGVSFASSTLQGGVSANWTLTVTTSATGALAGSNGTITITAPTGTNLQGTSYGGFYGAAVRGGGTIATITTADPIGDSTEFTIPIFNVTNPPAGVYPGSAFSVSTSSDGTPANPASGLTFVTSSVPGTPTSLGISAGTDDNATLSWTAPSSGGSPITGYIVTIQDGNTGVQTANACPGSTSSTATQCTVNSLIDGDNYFFSVAAINAVGEGPVSGNSTEVVATFTGGGGSGGGGSGGGGSGGGGSGGGGGGGGGPGSTVGPTNAPPPSGLAPSAYGTPVSVHIAATGSTTVSASLGSASATITVPQGAMPTGTTVSIYPVPDSSSIDAEIPEGSTFVTSFAVSWENPDGTALNSTTPVTMTITDPSIQAGNSIYIVTSKGLTNVGTATVNGTVTVTFSSDPVYAIASSMVAQAALSITSTSGHVGTALRLVTTGGSGTGALSFSVAKGTASGCAISSGSLTARSAGTCIVTASKAADPNYDAVTSNATTIAFSLPANPSKITAMFATGKSTLSAGTKAALRSLAKKLLPGAAVTVTGYAKGQSLLARSRAEAVAKYLKQFLHVKVTLKTVTTSHSNEATITTNKQ